MEYLLGWPADIVPLDRARVLEIIQARITVEVELG
jgi:hypothetical protein